MFIGDNLFILIHSQKVSLTAKYNPLITAKQRILEKLIPCPH